MEHNGQVSASWLVNKAIKTISLKSPKELKNNADLQEVRLVIDELNSLRGYFDQVKEPELIEYAIYREKAAMTRLSYLIKKIKYDMGDSSNYNLKCK